MSAPSAWARRLLGINDARAMTEKLRDMDGERSRRSQQLAREGDQSRLGWR